MATRRGNGRDDDLLGSTQDDFLIGAAGNDALNGNAGNDTLDGGVGDDNLAGGNGNDRLLGGAGDDRMNGGAGEDRLSGGAGDDVAVGGSGDDVVNGGSGQDFLLGGSGDDKLVWDPNDFNINGGVGFDTLSVGGATVDLIGDTNLRNIEAIDMRARGANTLRLDAASVVSDTDSRNLLRVFGDNNDSLELVGVWNRVRSPVAGYTRYVSGAAKVDVENTVAVTYGNQLSLGNLNGINGIHINGANVLPSNAGDVNGDGFDDLLIGAPTNISSSDPGSAYLIFGTANGIPTNIDLDNLRPRQGMHLTGLRPEHYAGNGVSIVGDLNHDGFDDFVVMSGITDPNSLTTSLHSYIVFGHAGAFPTSFAMNRVNGENGYILDGLPIDEAMGGTAALSTAGDFNGDGYQDFALGLRTASSAEPFESGSTFIVFGAAAPYDRSVDIRVLNATEAWRINGAQERGQIGGDLASGDINGDGFDDVLMSSGGGKPAYVVFGKADGFDSALSVASLDGSNGFALTSALVGGNITAADLNGDGFDDVIIQDLTNNVGSVRVVFGHSGAFASTVSLNALDGTNGFTMLGGAEINRGSFAISSAGDVNGDGYEDLLIGVPHATANRQVFAGATYVVFGHGGAFDAQLNLAQMDISQGLRINGVSKNQFSGNSASSVGDLNGDGFGDIAIAGFGLLGTPNSPPPDGTYIVYGRDFNNSVAFEGTARGDVLTGTDSGEALVGGRGNDLLNGGAGSDSLIGGANNDVLVWDAADHRIDGGSGFDTLRFDGADQTLDLTLLPSKVITGINVVDLTGSGDNHLRLSLQDLLQMSDNGALRVAGNAGDSVETTTTGWTQIADQSIGGNNYHAYLHGSATLLIDSDLTQTVT
jgi:RTX calcium-binding nonapeptide repeat (4 copies)/FG-GAP repeat